MKKYGRSSSFVKKSSSLKVVSKLRTRNRWIKEIQYFNSNVQNRILPKVRVKQKLSIDEQIIYMKYKGITFNLINEVDAKNILSKTNYYYKLSVSRKLFDKGLNNQYKLLDFSFLVDLSSIDMGIRYFLLQMCLDIEHSLKVALIDELTTNPRVDAYTIVRQFKNRNKLFYNDIVKRFSRTEYMKDMYSKRGMDIPFWVLLEILDMGGLIRFLSFYTKKNKATKNLNSANNIAIYAKNIRNCCAHSSAFLYNMVDDNCRIPANSRIVTYGKHMEISSKDSQYRKINDLIALFYLHKILCTNTLNNRRSGEGKNLIDRAMQKSDYYSSNEKLKRSKAIFSKLLDYLSN